MKIIFFIISFFLFLTGCSTYVENKRRKTLYQYTKKFLLQKKMIRLMDQYIMTKVLVFLQAIEGLKT